MLKKIIIDNFKSIAHESIELERFNVVVGPNNHGKTNILNAIDFLYNSSNLEFEILKCVHGTGNDIKVEAVFDRVEEFIPLAPRTQHQVIRENLENGELTIRRTFSRGQEKPGYIEIVSPSGSVANRNGIDNAIKTMLPRLEYVQVSMKLDDTAKIQKTNYLGTMLYDIFTKVTPEAEDAYKQPLNDLDQYFNNPDSRTDALANLNHIEDLIHGSLSRKFPDTQSVRLGVVLPKFDDLIKGFRIKINDGVDSDAAEKGEGMQRGLMVSIIEAYSTYLREEREIDPDEEVTENERSRIELKRRLPLLFAIDEAELHLHPSAQKDLKRAFYTLTEGGDQVIITTHSHILAKEIPSNTNIFKVEKNNQITTAEKLENSELFALIYELLGTDPSDLLFPQNICVVEGPSDATFLAHCLSLMQESETEKKQVVFHHCSGESRAIAASVGIDEMLKTAAYIPVYRSKLCVLVDDGVLEEKITEIRNFLADTDHKRVVKLTKPGIEHFYPESVLKNVCELGANLNIEEAIINYCSQANSSRDSCGALGSFNGTKQELAALICSNLSDASLIDDEIKHWLEIALEKSF